MGNRTQWKPKIGMKVYIHARDPRHSLVNGVYEVISVGRKYFYVSFRGRDARFEIENKLISDPWYPSLCFEAYPSKEAYQKEKEISIKIDRILKNLDNLSYDQIEQISNWLEI